MKLKLSFLCLQFGKVFRGLWRGTSVAVKKMVLPSCHGPRAAEAEKVSGGRWGSFGTNPGVVASFSILHPSHIAQRERMAIMEACMNTSLSHPNIVQVSLKAVLSFKAVYASILLVLLFPNGSTPTCMHPQTFTYSLKPMIDASPENNKDVASSPDGKNNLKSSLTRLRSSSNNNLAPYQPSSGPGGACCVSPTHSSQDMATGGRGSGSWRVIGFEVMIVMELCDCGSLRDMLDREVSALRPAGAGGAADYSAVLATAADIAKGMAQLHSLNIVHSDVKVNRCSCYLCLSLSLL